jgi:hypothetical protein
MAINLGGPSSTGYTLGGGAAVAPSGGPSSTPEQQRYADERGYWSLARCKRAYNDYLASKRWEILEQQESRRYRHGAHWMPEQIKVFNYRKQPVVTFNRLGRKIDGIVGLVEKLRTDPKAYPRTPRFQAGADLATAALRSVLDTEDWKPKSARVAEQCAVDGIGGLELILEQDQEANYNVTFEVVDGDGFFYDPRSRKSGFSDARYLGMGKWIDADMLKDALPGHDEEIENSIGTGTELTSMSAFDASSWFMSTAGDLRTVRLVHISYQHSGRWCWALFTGRAMLMQGESFFIDKNGKSIGSFLMFSAAVDHDGDHYGFPRNLKSAQDEINQRRSKGLHELHTRRLIAEKGAFDNIETARQEAVRPDGVVERNKGFEAEFDDQKKQQDIAGQLRFLEDARAEIENFGPNPALLGDQGVANRSGRAISLMQQAGVAELGPYIINYKNWKTRVYEAIFCAIKKYWTNERWIRVTDDDGIQQFVGINQMQVDPMTGAPVIVNAIGQLDVDIVLDEGPDTVTMMDDMYETLAQIVPAIAPMLSPPEVQAVIRMLIETSPLPATAKRQFREAAMAAQQPNPMAEQMQMLQLQGAQAKVRETSTAADLNQAKALQAGLKAMQPPPQPRTPPPKFELPPHVQVAQAAADINKTNADAFHKRALGLAEHHASAMVPIDYAHRALEAMHSQAVDRADLSLQRQSLDLQRQQAQQPQQPVP